MQPSREQPLCNLGGFFSTFLNYLFVIMGTGLQRWPLPLRSKEFNALTASLTHRVKVCAKQQFWNVPSRTSISNRTRASVILIS